MTGISIVLTAKQMKKFGKDKRFRGTKTKGLKSLSVSQSKKLEQFLTETFSQLKRGEQWIR